MKKPKKLAIKKITLRDLDPSTLDAVAAGNLAPPVSCVGRTGCPACTGLVPQR